MALVVPGVEIRVIKELVPRRAGATGILGIVGHTEIDRSAEPLQGFASLQAFAEHFGAGTLTAMPEVPLAFQNGVREVICAGLPKGQGRPAVAAMPLRAADGTGSEAVVQARCNGPAGNRIGLAIAVRGNGGAPIIDVQTLLDGEPAEPPLRNLSADRHEPAFFAYAVNRSSRLLYFPGLPEPGSMYPPLGSTLTPLVDTDGSRRLVLNGGTEAAIDAFGAGLARLETQPGIDLVTVSQRAPDARIATAIYSRVISHCERMSAIARNRIGFGEIPAHGRNRPNMAAVAEMAGTLVSDRFVLVAPHGYLGAVAGRVAALDYFESPTFKSLRGVVELSFDFSDPDLEKLLQAGVMPVDRVPRRGIAMVRGITTDNDQVSVRRIADRAVRHVQNIAQDFIGRLNTQAQRLALKQLLISAMDNMAQLGALVPMGDTPPYQVDVESSPSDFSQGVVRVHIAVRPVRAIDYISATVLVQAT
jgi:hypothetical protein